MADFTRDEQGVVAAAVRASIKHTRKGQRLMVRKFGDEADLTSGHARLALLESAYRKLGKDPANVERRDDDV